MTNKNKQVSEYWSEKLPSSDDFSSQLYWLAIPEVAARYNEKVTGDPNLPWYYGLLYELFDGRLPVDRMLSLGCGQGDLERSLAFANAFRICDAYDIAPKALETARQLALQVGVTGINYEARDLNMLTLPEQTYDAAWFCMSLHHVQNLEMLLKQVQRSLKPDGFLILNEYIGASRFDFSPHQKQILKSTFSLIPHRFRHFLRKQPTSSLMRQFVWHLLRKKDINFLENVGIPIPKVVQLIDPSEAVRSAEIMSVVQQYFDVVSFKGVGGTLLQYVLNNIAGNFRTDDPDSMKVLKMLFEIEDTLIEVGDLSHDFAVVTARPK